MKLQLVSIVMTAAVSTAAFAASKGYQVTGPVIDVNDTSVTIEKKKGENWTISKSASTKVTGDLKKGEKATVYYTMAADEIEVKPAKAEKKK